MYIQSLPEIPILLPTILDSCCLTQHCLLIPHKYLQMPPPPPPASSRTGEAAAAAAGSQEIHVPGTNSQSNGDSCTTEMQVSMLSRTESMENSPFSTQKQGSSNRRKVSLCSAYRVTGAWYVARPLFEIQLAHTCSSYVCVCLCKHDMECLQKLLFEGEHCQNKGLYRQTTAVMQAVPHTIICKRSLH